MEQCTELTSLNPTLHIAWKDWRTVYILKPTLCRLFPEVYKGNLVYRATGSSKRIPDAQIKNGAVKKKTVVKETV